MAALSLQNVTKIFPRQHHGEVAAVRGLNLEIADREMVVIVGPSGCGKTTTLRLIAGLEPLTSGQISIAGKSLHGVPAKDRGIAMVFQNGALYPYLTAAQNIAFGLKFERLSPAETERRVHEAAVVMGLTDLLTQKPRALSGGQQRRVAVARALVRRPRVFLFDEPLSNLEPSLRVQLRGEIKRLHERLRATMIYVTHDHEEALALADRLVVMREGKVQQIGAPAQVYEEPANQFVAGFLGSPAMNFLSGALHASSEEGLIFRETAPGTISWNFSSAPRAWMGRAVVLGLRPDDVRPVAVGGLSVVIDLVEKVGSACWITAQTGAHLLRGRAESKAEVQTGQRRRIEFIGPVHLFDAATGQRLLTA